MASTVRMGIVGVGNMGTFHVQSLLDGKIKRGEVTAICDLNQSKLDRFPAGSKLKHFTDASKMLRSGEIDAVLIATPHYDHTTIGVDALGLGLHVLVEKPLSVHKADCERLIAAFDARPRKEQVFAAMFNQRTNPAYIKLRQLIQAGELGELRRVNWIITDWYRTQNYYNSGGWRATWRGEGGGVLINQCPHQLDLMQWLFGQPVKVRGHCGLGKWHQIETEDAVTAYLEYANGATGIFVTTTGESPGTNRLEVVGDRGKIVIEAGQGGGNPALRFIRNTMPMNEHCKTSQHSFGGPETWTVEVPIAAGNGGQHNEVTQNFVDAILDGKPLIAQATEGIRSVELGNAMLLSSLLDRTLTLPLDSAMVRSEFDKLIASSNYVKPVVNDGVAADFAKSNASK